MKKGIFDISISQLIIKNNLIRKFIILYPLFRILSKFTRVFGFDLSICRYQSIVSLYLIKEDKKLYSLKSKGELINIGAGGFRHEKWINYDFPAKTKLYKKIQGKLNRDFLPIDLNGDISHLISKNIEACYLSHTLEHIPRKNSLKVINIIYDNLICGGIIRIVLPDIDKLYENIKINQQQYFEDNLYKLTNKIFGKVSKNNFKFNEINDIFIESNSSESFYKKLLLKWPYLEIPVSDHPEYHLGCWNKEFISKNIASLPYFKNCLILEKNKSQFKPFCNSAIFDTTEPQDSIYLEIMKK
jgi:predicted SAM-dependent methyltransferase